jgi:hypothetical protein
MIAGRNLEQVNWPAPFFGFSVGEGFSCGDIGEVIRLYQSRVGRLSAAEGVIMGMLAYVIPTKGHGIPALGVIYSAVIHLAGSAWDDSSHPVGSAFCCVWINLAFVLTHKLRLSKYFSGSIINDSDM